jgi:phage tail P2-like protein
MAMADPVLLPPSISDERGQVLKELAAQAASIPTQAAALYNIDTTPVPALPFLAEQFGVMGTSGWLLARTDIERRQLIKDAIAICRRKGTPWAIKAALAAVGWPGMVIEERLPGHWAKFAVSQAIPGKAVTGADLTLLRQTIETWKPARCVLDSIRFRLESEQASLPDGLFYNGAASYDGSFYCEGNYYDALETLGFGHDGIDHFLTLQEGAVDRSTAGRVVVRFGFASGDFNGLTINSFALYTGSGLQVAKMTRPSFEKTADLVLDATWILILDGAVP